MVWLLPTTARCEDGSRRPRGGLFLASGHGGLPVKRVSWRPWASERESAARRRPLELAFAPTGAAARSRLEDEARFQNWFRPFKRAAMTLVWPAACGRFAGEVKRGAAHLFQSAAPRGGQETQAPESHSE
ncbi:hypothetical protein EYF80_062116 [Liparis tanakae]|uniref:Uncharacterized protein n=1 Tax=Liparis tanakae TaxID=230148 RepID=A0A4Z2EFM3_9TELE|nr:hypothetical protein EYF80_062116 [Liparis tanakae]